MMHKYEIGQMTKKEMVLDNRDCKLPVMAMAISTDGHIGIKKHIKPFGYSIYIGFTNTNVKLIEWVVENFGGKMPKISDSGNIKWKDRYVWKVDGYKAYKVLKIIRPYLIIKGGQADLLLELYEKVSKWKYTRYNGIPEHKRKLAEELYQRCKVLNKRGKPTEQVEPEPRLKMKVITLEEYE